MSPAINSGERRDKKRKYRSDGSAIWSRPIVDGPGIWATCVKGKERQTVGELYDLFETLAEELWPEDAAPTTGTGDSDDDDADENGGSLEEQIARQVAAIKRPRKEHRFANCITNTPCVVFISSKPPINPVQLVTRHIENVHRTGVTNTRNTHRLVPISASCTTHLPEIRVLATRILNNFFAAEPERSYSYKIELHVRNHSTLKKEEIVREIAGCVPAGHKVELSNPDVFVLVEVFKSVCGMSVVKDYYKYQKFNVMELSASVAKEKANAEAPPPNATVADPVANAPA